jgi:hypothetical protein
MNDNQIKVINWIRSEMDYAKGIDLLVEFTKKPMYSDQFTGREKSMAGKLAYEICKVAKLADHVSWKDFIRSVQTGNSRDAKLASLIAPKTEQLPTDFPEIKMPEFIPGKENKQEVFDPDSAATTETKETLETKPLAQCPPVIRRIIHEYAALFQERSKLHSVMTNMPESNADSVCAKRAELFDLIKSISARLEIIYEATKAFEEKGIVPEECSVFPTAGKEEAEEAEPDLSSLDDATLKKHKKNFQGGNSKDQIILDYQSKERCEMKKPMPAGPKRVKLEKRISDRNKKIAEIETLLLKLSC